MNYSLSEFRAKLREAFNAAEKGEPVYIERYDETYELRKTRVRQLPDGSHAIIIMGGEDEKSDRSE